MEVFTPSKPGEKTALSGLSKIPENTWMWVEHATSRSMPDKCSMITVRPATILISNDSGDMYMLKPRDVRWPLYPESTCWTLYGNVHWALCNHTASNGCFLNGVPVGRYHEASMIQWGLCVRSSHWTLCFPLSNGRFVKVASSGRS
jgi:hypothetical protein